MKKTIEEKDKLVKKLQEENLKQQEELKRKEEELKKKAEGISNVELLVKLHCEEEENGADPPSSVQTGDPIIDTVARHFPHLHIPDYFVELKKRALATLPTQAVSEAESAVEVEAWMILAVLKGRRKMRVFGPAANPFLDFQQRIKLNQEYHTQSLRQLSNELPFLLPKIFVSSLQGLLLQFHSDRNIALLAL